MDTIACTYRVKPEDILHLDPLFEHEYLLYVLMREGAKQWAAWMSTDASNLAPHIFHEEVA